MMNHSADYLLLASLTLACCGDVTNSQTSLSAANSRSVESKSGTINVNGTTVKSRFSPPEGYARIPADEKSFTTWLRDLPLKPAGTQVRYYNGDIKDVEGVYEAVVDMEISPRNLQQCADAVMRLRGEYLYSRRAYDQISFTLTNGFKVDYSEWMKGNRVMVNGNKTVWRKTAEPSNTYKDFRDYMDFVFTYAGTLSLSRTLISKEVKDIASGDVFIVGGSPGHAVIVVDVAKNKKGEKIFLLAQSYMPAQETQILKNNEDASLSPWYKANLREALHTPEWTFNPGQLMTW